MAPLATAIVEDRNEGKEDGRCRDGHEQEHLRGDRGGGVRTRLVARERQPRHEQVAVRERPERRQAEGGAGVGARREGLSWGAATGVEEPPNRQRRETEGQHGGTGDTDHHGAHAAARQRDREPRGEAGSREQHVRAGELLEPPRALEPTPDDRNRECGGDGQDGRPDGQWIVHVRECRDTGRSDRRNAEHPSPDVDRASHAVEEDTCSLFVASRETSRYLARSRRLEGERRDRAHDHDGEQRGHERVFVGVEDARERELEHRVEHVREAHGDREQHARAHDRHRTMASTTNAAPTTTSVTPSARRSASSEKRPVI